MSQENCHRKPSQFYSSSILQNCSYSFILLVFFLISNTFSQLELSYHELVEMNTSVSDKNAQSLVDAPGFVSVYSQDQLEAYGAFSIEELAKLTPGYNNQYNFGEGGLMTRGVGGYGWDNNSHLFLIDGIPFRMVRSNKVYTNYASPLHFAQSVELLRGPASALYGVGAFGGVIQVNTLQPGLGQSLYKVRASLGDRYATRMVQVSSATSTRQGETIATLGYYTRLANNQPIYQSSSPTNSRIYDNPEDSKFGYVKHQYKEGPLKDISLGAVYSESNGGVGEFWDDFNYGDNRVTWRSIMPFVKHQFSLNPKLQIKSYLSYNRSEEEGSFIGRQLNSDQDSIVSNSYTQYKAVVEGLDLQSEIHQSFGRYGQLIMGFNYFQTQALGKSSGSGGFTIQETYIANKELDQASKLSSTLSGFVQASDRYPVLAGLLITTGIRLDNGSYGHRSYQQASPRISMVQKITPKLSLKTLYSSALKAPGAKEFGTNIESETAVNKYADILEGMPNYEVDLQDIGAEIINTGEFGLTYQLPSTFFSINTFYTIVKNPLQQYNLVQDQPKTYNPNDPNLSESELSLLQENNPLNQEVPAINAYRNAQGSNEIIGLESEIKYSSNTIDLFINHTFTEALAQSDFSNSDIPHNMYKAGLHYTTTYLYPTSLGIWGQYVDKYMTWKSLHGKKTWVESDDHFDTGMTARQSIGTQTYLEIKVTNLLNSRGYLYRDSERFIPRQGREFQVGLSSQF